MKVVSLATGKRAGVITPVKGNFGTLVLEGEEGTVEFVLDSKQSKGTKFVYNMVNLEDIKEYEEYEFFKGGVMFELD